MFRADGLGFAIGNVNELQDRSRLGSVNRLIPDVNDLSQCLVNIAIFGALLVLEKFVNKMKDDIK